ncbi:SMP-30/gluconolactonase/LRE family protein [Rhizobium sp. XQZ8]|uniref:SMP-30/gluconolactonase/LRE family protein n=1 Tax=Rhizobium populisoli TaxID=2859785 RepID=UPI001C67EC32|nr:SMP-30/gluconolactonase/LRE family protein [Rhizobium populisoli]MBW6425393.1 SMP-30/gluconolactonase/LRE family protein [Rhizobium populisoli]
MIPQLLDEDLPKSQLGEGAFWDGRSSTFYWVDIKGKAVHAFQMESRSHQSWSVSKEVSFVFTSATGGLVLGLRDGIYDFDPATGRETPIARIELPHDHRLNDGKLDPKGRLWVGSINTSPEPSETAGLYVLKNGMLELFEGGFTNANGKAWSTDGALMYHADTGRGTIWVYDYDLEQGVPTNKRVFVKKDGWSPDGLCMDPENRLLVAVFGGAALEIYTHRGDLIQSVELPVPNVTSSDIADGEIIITTAYDGMSDADQRRAPMSGAVFCVPLPG